MRRIDKPIEMNAKSLNLRHGNTSQPTEKTAVQKLDPRLNLSHPARPFSQIYDVMGKWSMC